MDKKEQIIHIAMQLFSERGFENTPLSLICETAQVSKGLIFHHFKSKNGLLREIFSRTTQRIAEINQSPAPDQPAQIRLSQLLEAFFAQLEADQLMVQLNLNLILQPRTREVLQDLVAERSQLILASVQQIFKDLDPENYLVQAYLLVAELDGIALNYLCIFEDYPLAQIKAHLTQRYLTV